MPNKPNNIFVILEGGTIEGYSTHYNKDGTLDSTISQRFLLASKRRMNWSFELSFNSQLFCPRSSSVEDLANVIKNSEDSKVLIVTRTWDMPTVHGRPGAPKRLADYLLENDPAILHEKKIIFTGAMKPLGSLIGKPEWAEYAEIAKLPHINKKEGDGYDNLLLAVRSLQNPEIGNGIYVAMHKQILEPHPLTKTDDLRLEGNVIYNDPVTSVTKSR